MPEEDKPVWRKGRLVSLKKICWKQRVGSTPTTGTKLKGD